MGMFDYIANRFEQLKRTKELEQARQEREKAVQEYNKNYANSMNLLREARAGNINNLEVPAQIDARQKQLQQERDNLVKQAEQTYENKRTTIGENTKENTKTEEARQRASENASGFVSGALQGIADNIGSTLNTYLAHKSGAMAPGTENLKRQAEMHDKQAGDEQKNAQQNFQIANRNYRVEAEKNAASQAATENAQKVNNMGNASAGAAALNRGVVAADYNTHMQRSDQQRAEGVKNQREMWGARQTAEEERGAINENNYAFRDTLANNTEAEHLSKGGIPDDTGNQQQQEVAPQQEQAQVKEQAPAKESTAEESTPDSATMQNAINYANGSDVRRTQDGNGNIKGFRISADGTITRDPNLDKGDPSVLPNYTAADEAAVKHVASTNSQLKRENHESGAAFTDFVNSTLGRGGNRGDPGSQFDKNQGNTLSANTPSDERMKNIIRVLTEYKY